MRLLRDRQYSRQREARISTDTIGSILAEAALVFGRPKNRGELLLSYG